MLTCTHAQRQGWFPSWIGLGGCLLMVLASQVVAAEPQATPAERIVVPEGFRVELLYSVPAETQGSWVNMTSDPQGRLIVSDQYGSLYRVTTGASTADTKIEKLEVAIGQAQGLLYAFDSLYVMVNGGAAQGSGLYRVRDTDGDDQFDQVQLLRAIRGGGEHGPHAIVLSPDGKSLYVCAGNHTTIPDPETARLPRNWAEDQLLPRMWDAGGHAVGILAPGGWVAKTDPEGKSFELVAAGFRNEYDIAFNLDGELFTYDADMEWDIGSPWYRPTRINHVVSGGEFGWRSGTGKWPAHYPDSLPATADVGPGSPTGITFGTGAKFPAKYQRALFVSDWSYGLIYAVFLTPDGSSYKGEVTRFATASPLPVTDIIVNPIDQAMYVTIGGRRTQSGLYRITYVGSESTEPVTKGDETAATARAQRRLLEGLHVRSEEPTDVIDMVWDNLDHADRFIRYAARIAIEHQPVDVWQERALEETRPNALLTAAVALARCGKSDAQAGLIEALGRLSWDKLDRRQKLDLLRAYGLAFIRLGEPTAAMRETVIARLDSLFPAAGDDEFNRELASLLAYLHAPGIVPRILQQLALAQTQEQEIHYVLVLRTLADQFDANEAQQYYSWFRTAGAFRGGNSFAGFLRNIRSEATAKLNAQRKEELGSLLEAPIEQVAPDLQLAARPFVKKWTVSDLLESTTDQSKPRSFERGRAMFAAAACYKCHRFAGQGGIIGPDLSGVGQRFTPQYVLEALIEPSKVISDQYQASTFVTTDGRTVTGKVANLNGKNLLIVTNMLEPGKFTSVNVDTIEEQFPSPISMMPQGLLDTLSQDEILDLVAYLRSGGDPNHTAFRDVTASR
jgi:putative heme-binding domain-containing protein